jgi:hypothetical protein
LSTVATRRETNASVCRKFSTAFWPSSPASAAVSSVAAALGADAASGGLTGCWIADAAGGGGAGASATGGKVAVRAGTTGAGAVRMRHAYQPPMPRMIPIAMPTPAAKRLSIVSSGVSRPCVRAARRSDIGGCRQVPPKR